MQILLIQSLSVILIKIEHVCYLSGDIGSLPGVLSSTSSLLGSINEEEHGFMTEDMWEPLTYSIGRQFDDLLCKI